ncbi:S1 family peptidase [Amycolatopsis sp. DSM 110486]|uniref:S1 family peptidase n=1 Tax=Amycolatopsis sp. DSM 110486 TaxID=2865832 RepID=UPI001C69D1AD|nr:S1 family peptidase [Amycolatopsis sp. DSM 110486]QYN25432.1 S1 family peptidase [Amycolatopsis sp. DSM 110486]
MTSRKTFVAGFTVFSAAALTAGLCVSAASASPLAFAQMQTQAITQATQVVDSLGLSGGGIYLDNGKAIVNVTDAAAQQKAEAAGFATKLVKHSFAALTNAKNSLDGVKNVPQTAWGIDTKNNQVVVKIYDAASKTTVDKVTAAAAKLGDSARIEHRAGKLSTYIADGDSINNGQFTCSLGFNVTRGGEPMMLTAGHCTNEGGTWSGGDVSGARVVESDCPGADSGLLTRPNGSGDGAINTGQTISSAGTPTVGEQIQKQGQTTGGGSGEVTSVDESVNFDVGVLNHEFGTTAHTDHGDSGGPAYDGSKGLGTLSGGDTVTSYFYPLTLELQSYGLELA